MYDPAVVVHHHRRTVFAGHLRQIRSYALHRGFFVKKFPQTSMKLSYFVPSLFTAGTFLGWIAGYVWQPLFGLWLAVLGVYAILVCAFSLRTANPLGVLGTACGTFLTHVTYGVWFLKGLFATELND